MDFDGARHDAAFAGELLAERARIAGLRGYAALTRTWERASPASYGRAQALLGRDPQARPEARPLPEMGSTIEIDGIRMRIDPRMSEHNIRKLARGRHTQHERALLRRSLRDDDRVMELGGGIGMVAIDCARRLGGDRVASYEASPRMESLIRDNYALNDVTPTLTMAMVGERSGTRTFHVADRFSRSSAHTGGGEGTVPVEVPVLALSEEMAKHRPSVLVCDIQGGETELFGFADLSSLRMVLVEVHPDMIGLAGARAVARRIRGAGLRDAGRAGQSLLFRRP